MATKLVFSCDGPCGRDLEQGELRVTRCYCEACARLVDAGAARAPGDLPAMPTGSFRRQPDAVFGVGQQLPGGVAVAQAAEQPPAVSQVTVAVPAGPAPASVTSMHEAAGGTPQSAPGVVLGPPVVASPLPVIASPAVPPKVEQ